MRHHRDREHALPARPHRATGFLVIQSAASHIRPSNSVSMVRGSWRAVADLDGSGRVREGRGPPEGSLRRSASDPSSDQAPSNSVDNATSPSREGPFHPPSVGIHRRALDVAERRGRGRSAGEDELRLCRGRIHDGGGRDLRRVAEDHQTRRRHQIEVDLVLELIEGERRQLALRGHHEADPERGEERTGVIGGAGQHLVEGLLQRDLPRARERSARVERRGATAIGERVPEGRVAGRHDRLRVAPGRGERLAVIRPDPQHAEVALGRRCRPRPTPRGSDRGRRRPSRRPSRLTPAGGARGRARRSAGRCRPVAGRTDSRPRPVSTDASPYATRIASPTAASAPYASGFDTTRGQVARGRRATRGRARERRSARPGSPGPGTRGRRGRTRARRDGQERRDDPGARPGTEGQAREVGRRPWSRRTR